MKKGKRPTIGGIAEIAMRLGGVSRGSEKGGQEFIFRKLAPGTGTLLEEPVRIASSSIIKEDKLGKQTETPFSWEKFVKRNRAGKLAERIWNDPRYKVWVVGKGNPIGSKFKASLKELYVDTRFEQLADYLKNYYKPFQKEFLKERPPYVESEALRVSDYFKYEKKLSISPDSVKAQMRKMGLLSGGFVPNFASELK
ncbi:MAG: hypothetical protein V1746_04970 [bacterium]